MSEAGRPSDATAAFIVLRLLVATAASLWCSAQPAVWLWGLGQLGLTLCFLQWFIVLHECGHRTLFATRRLNPIVGHIAGFFAGFPFFTWRSIHHQHHRWTGWQDRDPTTAVLADKTVHPAVRVIMNACWRLWIPVFALMYRWGNYWNAPRLWRLFPRPARRRQHMANIAVLAGIYLGILVWLGSTAVTLLAVPIVAVNMLMDVLLLSQHSHIPMKLSRGAPVEAMSHAEQVPYTRSLRFPDWISRGLLLGFDAHELHHEHPTVPGYRLPAMRAALPEPMPNEFHWLRWTVAAKSTPADVFLYSNRDRSGLTL